MSIVIAGSSGLIGAALTQELHSQGKRVVRLVRRPAESPDEVSWDPATRQLDTAVLRGAEAVVSLGGASVGRLPWTKRYREQLWHSRITSTQTIAGALRTLAAEGSRTPLFVSASASGFYGSAPGAELTEHSAAGDTFLARLCVAWEAEALRASDVAEVTLLRTSPVLHAEGVLRPMIRLTRLGLGGPLGSGRQMWPWISLEDEVRAILHVLDQGLTGPVNLAAPCAATQEQIGRALAHTLRRPFLLPAPAFALRATLGRDAADSLLLANAHVVPEALTQSGFGFSHPSVGDALASMQL